MNQKSLLLFGLLACAALARAGDAGKKVVPVVMSEPEVKLFSFDVEERLRFEVRSNHRDFDDDITDLSDQSYLLSRFRFGLTVKPARWLKLYAQTQDSHEWGSSGPRIPGLNSAEGDDLFDLRQGYVEFADYENFPLGLAVGRIALVYGDGRLYADSQWGNFARTFDTVKLRYQQPKWWAEAFFARPVQIQTEVFNNNDAADNAAGFYLSNQWLPFQTTDFYVIYRDKGDNQPDLSPTNRFDPRGSWNGPAARFTTIGARFDSNRAKLHGWDYNVELAYQNGDLWVGDRSTPKLDLHAFASHAALGYTFEQTAWQPRLGLEYNYASGDRNPDDGKSESFQNMLPSQHDKYGLMDEFGWRNLHDVRVQVSARPVKNLDVSLSYHAFWLADSSDYFFRGGSSPLRTTTPAGLDVRQVGASNFAGHELDLYVRWSPLDWLKFDVGYAHLIAGDYLADTGPHDDADYAYAQATVKF